MSPTIDEIIDELSQRGSASFQDVVDLANQEPARLPDLVRRGARRLAQGSTAIDAVLDIVPEEELQSVADECVAALLDGADSDDSQAARLISLLSLQAPHTLRSHLTQLRELHPNQRSYDAEWPWRGAKPGADIDMLRARLATEDPEIRERAWRCLVETRTPDGWKAAIEAVGSVLDDAWALERFLWVGVELQPGGVRPLVTEPSHHILFPDGFLRPFQWVRIQGRIEHPTWTSDGVLVGRGRFGGSIDEPCKICGRPLSRLLAIDESPSSISGPTELVTCLSCLMWSEPILFFAHRDGGITPAGPEVAERQPEWPADPFPEVPLMFVRSSQRWQRQDWGLSNSGENLNRLGGEPTWIKSPYFPLCPECGERMPFVLQLDSLEIDGTPAWLWGSGGIIYAFWCSRDSISATLCQWT